MFSFTPLYAAVSTSLQASTDTTKMRSHQSGPLPICPISKCAILGSEAQRASHARHHSRLTMVGEAHAFPFAAAVPGARAIGGIEAALRRPQ